MQELKRLTKIVSTSNPKVLPVVDPTDNISLEGKLYHLIRAGTAQTDEEACLSLYGEKKLTSSYRMLKSRLRKKLLNSLIFIELSESRFRRISIIHTECLSLIQQANKLFILSEPIIAEKIADQVIAIASKGSLNDILAKAYEIKQQADLLSHNRSRFEKNIELLQYHFSLDAKEREALLLYNRLKFEVSINISNSRRQGVVYKEYLQKLKELWQETKSPKIYDYYYLMYIGHCEISGDYEGIIKAINEAEDLLVSNILDNLWFNERFNNFIKVYAYLRLYKLDEGLYYANLHLDSFMEGSANWFAFLENYVTLALHKKDYNLAIKLSLLAADRGALESLIPGIRERWGLYIRHVQLVAPKSTVKNELAASITNYETAIISKDKEGLNLPLLILEYLENLPALDADDFEQYAMRFSKYSSKYLKGEVAARAKLFIKLLLLGMKEQGERLEKKTAPLLKELQSTPPPRDPFAEVEIIPYEHLWELVLELLQQRAKL